MRSSDAVARISAGAVNLTATGQGGVGGIGNLATPAGPGGDGTGGTIAVIAEPANGTLAFGATTLAADGLGGAGGAADNNTDGGAGGTGQGGEVIAGTVAGPAPGGGGPATGGATFASADLSARGIGGAGGFGAGAGGDGAGGAVGLIATGAATNVTGATILIANGQAALGGGSPGGAVGIGGQATGGVVTLDASAHPTTTAPGTLNLNIVTGSADALGNGPGNVAGEWHVGASGSSTVTMTQVALTALAQGPGIGVPVFSSFEARNGTIRVNGTGRFRTDGDIQVNAALAGQLTGSRYELIAGRDVVLSHTAPGAGIFTIDAADLFVQAARDVAVNANAATRTTNITDLRALRNAIVAGRVTGRELRIGSIDLDLQATGAIGDAGTELVILDVDGGDNGPLDTAPPPFLGLAANQFTVLGGTTQGPGYTLTNAEAGRIRPGPCASSCRR